jgi:hypothetical protein
MDSINPLNNPYGAQGPNQSNSNQEPESIIESVLGLFLIFQGGVEWGNDNNGSGNFTTGQLMAKYINTLVTQITAEEKNGTASLADQTLLKNLTAGSPSLATLANNIVTAANQTPPVLDETDIDSLISAFQSGSGPAALVLSQITDSSDSSFWFNPANTNLGNALQWNGDSSQITFLMNTFMTQMGPLIAGMENGNNTPAQQMGDAQAYAQEVMQLYDAFNKFPSNPFTQVFDDFMNTFVPGQGSATLLGFMQLFANSSPTPTQAQLQEFINILDPNQSDYANNGFQAILGDIFRAMQNSGMFQDGPTT